MAEQLNHSNMPLDLHVPEIRQLFVDRQLIPSDKMGINALAIDADLEGRLEGNAVRPKPGTVERHSFGPDGVRALTPITSRIGIDNSHRDAVLGEGIAKVWLNHRSCLSGIPVKVWEFILDGRQVLPKWLLYREISILGRPLSSMEIRFFGDMIHRLTGLLLLRTELDRLWEKSRE